MHPLMGNLTELNDQELHEKMTKILERMSFAQNTGNAALYQQANNIYMDILDEQYRRAQKPIDPDEDDPFDGLINVKK
jgi:hypothetical protein